MEKVCADQLRNTRVALVLMGGGAKGVLVGHLADACSQFVEIDSFIASETTQTVLLCERGKIILL